MAGIDRREFIRRSLCATANAAAFTALAGKLELAQAGSLPTLLGSAPDYRALVCVFLYGGNDCFNMIVPRDGGHATYAATRAGLAIPSAQLLPLTPQAPPIGGGAYGLHPGMAGLQSLFDSGRAAIVANAGPLVRPVNKALYQTPGTPLPAQLFSHSDQSVLWQTPRADTAARTGWGGRLADIFAADNGNQTLSMNVSLDGDNVFQAGIDVSPYFMSAQGVEQIDSVAVQGPGCGNPGEWNRRRCLTFNALLDRSHAHPFQRAYAGKVKATMAISAELRAALATYPDNDPVYRPFWDAHGLPWNPDNLVALPRLAAQLLMIARVIRVRGPLDMQRQLFFAGLGGFDTHDRQLEDHPALLRDLSQSLLAFDQVLGSPAFGVADRVTTFTASEFGRTLSINGDGTDHGWGGHQIVMGGSVRGGRIYGRMPDLSAGSGNPDNAGWGQIIPTLSVDQYAATLAAWFGLQPAERDLIFPNLVHMTGPLLSIAGPDLGFMQALG